MNRIKQQTVGRHDPVQRRHWYAGEGPGEGGMLQGPTSPKGLDKPPRQLTPSSSMRRSAQPLL